MENGGQEKTRSPKQVRGIQTKKEIIEGAMVCFAEKGYFQTNTKQIAKQAGVSIGSFYSYFTDKKAVLLAGLDVYFDVFYSIIEQNIPTLMNGADKDHHTFVRKLVDIVIDAHSVLLGFHKVLDVMYYSDSEIRERVNEKYHRTSQFVLATLKNSVVNLSFENIDAASSLVFWTLQSLVDVIAFSKTKVDHEVFINELTLMLERYLFH